MSAYCARLSSEEPSVLKGPRERVRYRFDRMMTKGTPALVGWLGLFSVLLVAVVSILVIVLAPDTAAQESTGRVWWLSLLHTLDTAGLHEDRGGTAFLGLMLVATVGGIFIVSTLIGILTTGLNKKIEDLRKGRSKIVENGHVVILGWSDQLFTILSELRDSAEDGRVTIAILAERDSAAMEDDIRSRIGRSRRLRIVCRTGNPTEPSDLDIVRPETARVIILPESGAEDGDLTTIKTLLAMEHRTWPNRRPRVVAAVAASKHFRVAELAGGEGARVIDGDDMTARFLVQSRRHPGLSVVYNELLDFAGDEIYFRRERRMAGRTFRQAVHAFDNATLLGVQRADGRLLLNPAPDLVLGHDDDLVVLASNSGSIKLAGGVPAQSGEVSAPARPLEQQAPEQTLILGWNTRGATVLRLLDDYQPSGSRVHVAAAPDALTSVSVTGGQLRHLSLTTSASDTVDPAALVALDPAAYHHVMVLSDDGLPAQRADSRALATLLHLRDIKRRGDEQFAIVSELKDDINRRLATATRADDFVVGSRMIGLLLTQLSTNDRLGSVFAELLSPGGVDIYLEPAELYVRAGEPTNFAAVLDAAQRRGQTALGYRIHAQTHAAPGFGVVLNPSKTAPLTLGTGDRVVVLTSPPRQ
jgi:hypothetical protein